MHNCPSPHEHDSHRKMRTPHSAADLPRRVDYRVSAMTLAACVGDTFWGEGASGLAWAVRGSWCTCRQSACVVAACTCDVSLC